MKTFIMTIIATITAMWLSTATAQCPAQGEKKTAAKCESCGCSADAKKADCKCDKCACCKKADAAKQCGCSRQQAGCGK